MSELTIRQALRERDLMLSLNNIQWISVSHNPKLKIKIMFLLGEYKIYYTGEYKEKDGCYIISDAVVLTTNELMFSDTVRVPINHVMFICDMPECNN